MKKIIRSAIQTIQGIFSLRSAYFWLCELIVRCASPAVYAEHQLCPSYMCGPGVEAVGKVPKGL